MTRQTFTIDAGSHAGYVADVEIHERLDDLKALEEQAWKAAEAVSGVVEPLALVRIAGQIHAETPHKLFWHQIAGEEISFLGIVRHLTMDVTGNAYKTNELFIEVPIKPTIASKPGISPQSDLEAVEAGIISVADATAADFRSSIEYHTLKTRYHTEAAENVRNYLNDNFAE